MLDFAFGATAHGRMQVYQQKGIPIPEGWAFDQDGRPTTDIDEALAGLVQPIGMYKGIGLAMAAGILSTLLSGAGYGTESGNMVDGPIPGRDGQFYLALDIAAFEDVATFKARMDRIIREYQGTRLAPGVKRVYVPGEMEAELERRQRDEGIPLNEATVQGIRDAAARPRRRRLGAAVSCTHARLPDRRRPRPPLRPGRDPLRLDDGQARVRRAARPRPSSMQARGAVASRRMVWIEVGADPGQHLQEASLGRGARGARSAHQGHRRARAARARRRGRGRAREARAHRRCTGIRRLLQDEPDDAFCLRPGFVEGVRLLARLDLSFDLCVRHHQLASAVELVRRCPEVRFVLDHIGKPGDPRRADGALAHAHQGAGGAA